MSDEQLPLGVSESSAHEPNGNGVPETEERATSEIPAERGRMTGALVSINVAIFLIMVAATGWSSALQPEPETLLSWGANLGPRAVTGESWRLLTNNFIHVGILHLGLNMYFLWTVGRMVEGCFGSARLLVIYLLSGLAGSLASVWWNPTLISAGASGAIYGVVGALVSFLVGHRKEFPRRQLRFQLVIMTLFVGYSLLYSGLDPRIDNAAHLGGLLAGFTAGLCLLPPSPRDRSWSRGDIVTVLVSVFVILSATPLLMRHVATDRRVVTYERNQEGNRLLRQEKFGEALAKFEEVVKLEPDKGLGYTGRALALLGLKQYPQAVANCDAAIKRAPRDPVGYLARASALHYLGEDRKAIEDHNRVLAINSRQAAALNARAWSHIVLGQYDKAVEDASRAVQINPRMSVAYDTRGVAFYRLGQLERALDDFSTALSIDPKEGACYFHRGQVYERQGKADAAAAEMSRGLQLGYKPEPWETASESRSGSGD